MCPEAGGPIQYPGFNGTFTSHFSFANWGYHNDYFYGFLNFVILFLLQTLGELICPAYHELCDVDPEPVSGQCPNACNFNGDCINGRCNCFLGFDGYDCSKRKLLNLFLLSSF